MKTCSKTVLLLSALCVSAFLSGQTFAEGVAMPGANLIAYQGVGTSGQVTAEAVAMPGANLIAYHGVEKTTTTSAEGAFCPTTSAKRANSNFNSGAIGLLSARSNC